LLDKLLATPTAFRRLTELNPVRLRQAHRYVFDASASRLLSNLVAKAAPLILREHEFARAPHPATWVEFDFDAFARNISEMALGQDATADLKVGYLIDGNRAFMASESRTTVGFVPYWYELHHTLSFDEELERAREVGLSRLMYRMILLGSAGLGDITNDWWRSAEAADFCRSNTMEFSDYAKKRFTEPETKLTLMQSAAGSIKDLVVMLLLLTKPGRHVVSLTASPAHGHTIFKGKLATLQPHHKVTIHLSLPKAEAKFLDHIRTGQHHRYHSVRGGWAQTRRGVGHCTHVWEPDDQDHWHCLHC